MKKAYLTAALFFLMLLAPLDAHAASKKLAAPKIKQGSSVKAWTTAKISIKEKKGYKYYYTTDGKTPSKNSKQYKKPVNFKYDGVFKVIGYYRNKQTEVARCVITYEDNPIKMSLKGTTSWKSVKNYKGEQTLTISTPVTYGDFYYSIDEKSTKKIGKKTKVTLKHGCTVNIWYKVDGKSRLVKSYQYIINNMGIKASHGTGTYKKPITVSFTAKDKHSDLSAFIYGTGITGYKVIQEGESYKLKKGSYKIYVSGLDKNGKLNDKVYGYKIK